MRYILTLSLVMAASTPAMAAKSFTYSKWYVVTQESGVWTYAPVATYSECQSSAASLNAGTKTAWCHVSGSWAGLKKLADDPASNMAALPGVIE